MCLLTSLRVYTLVCVCSLQKVGRVWLHAGPVNVFAFVGADGDRDHTDGILGSAVRTSQ